MTKQPTVYQKKQNALQWLAYASLKNWNEPTDLANISAEKSRIERVITDIYTKSKDETEYNQYVLNFIKEHGREIVYDDTYCYDISIPDEGYELNIDVIIDKMHRKQAGAKFQTCFSQIRKFAFRGQSGIIVSVVKKTGEIKCPRVQLSL